MAVNVRENTYAAKAILKDGSTIDLTPALVQLSWQDPTEEVAQRAVLRLAQVKTAKGYLHTMMALCTLVIITANGAERFRGPVWEWEYESSNKDRLITITCYDQFIYAQNSKTFAYFPSGKSTKDIVSTICGGAGIPLSYEWESTTHAKASFRSNSIADQILSTLEDAKRKLSSEPAVFFDRGTLYVKKEAYNSEVFVFDAAASAVSTSERLTLDRLVTKVAIYGAEDKEGRRKIETTVNGATQYGQLQDVVLRTSSMNLAQAKEEAAKILKENGKPQHTVTVEAPDVPQLRKGWKVRMNAGSLLGYFIVLGVTHNGSERSMTMELKRAA